MLLTSAKMQLKVREVIMKTLTVHLTNHLLNLLAASKISKMLTLSKMTVKIPTIVLNEK